MGEGFWGKWDVDYGYAESCWYLAAYFWFYLLAICY
jgi:hypothetical protein